MADQQSTLSPALAGMVAQLTMPQQYAKIVQATVLAMNTKCPRTNHLIDK